MLAGFIANFSFFLYLCRWVSFVANRWESIPESEMSFMFSKNYSALSEMKTSSILGIVTFNLHFITECYLKKIYSY